MRCPRLRPHKSHNPSLQAYNSHLLCSWRARQSNSCAMIGHIYKRGQDGAISCPLGNCMNWSFLCAIFPKNLHNESPDGQACSVKMPDGINTVNSPLTDTLVSGKLYLRTPFQIPDLPPKSNSVLTNSRKRAFFRKRTWTPLKTKSGRFFCLRSLVSGHHLYNNRLALGNDIYP